MNYKQCFLSILTFLFLLSCTSKSQKPIQEKNDEAKKLTEPIDTDSIRLEKALQSALKLAREDYKQEVHVDSFSSTLNSPISRIDTHVFTGNLFEDGNDYALIKRKFVDRIRINLYKKKAEQLTELINYKEYHLNYIGDTIFDVNGDDRKDVVIHQYPTSGCCLANVRRVFLNLEEGFSNEYEFLNPTFSPKEHIIRGIEYGHPGHTDLYKYQWNGLTVDTLEYISFLRDHRKKVQSLDTLYRLNSNKDTVDILLELPKEYQHIEAIDWFLDKL
ncbi:MAG: hypothetical protein AAF617_04020 [Bacteroidota bacterium]